MIINMKKTTKGKQFAIVVTLLVVLIVFGGVVGMQQFISMKKAEAARRICLKR